MGFCMFGHPKLSGGCPLEHPVQTYSWIYVIKDFLLSPVFTQVLFLAAFTCRYFHSDHVPFCAPLALNKDDLTQPVFNCPLPSYTRKVGSLSLGGFFTWSGSSSIPTTGGSFPSTTTICVYTKSVWGFFLSQYHARPCCSSIYSKNISKTKMYFTFLEIFIQFGPDCL